MTLNSFYPADAGTLVRTLEEIGGQEKRWKWQGGQAEDKTGYGGPAAQQREQSGKAGRGQSGEPGFEQKVALVRQALQRDREAHRRQEGNHYTVGNTAGRDRGGLSGGGLGGNSAAGAGTGGVSGGAAGGRSRPAFPTAGRGGAGQGTFNFPRTLPQDGRFESGRLNVPERGGVFGQGGAPRLPGWNEAQRVPVTYGLGEAPQGQPRQQWPQQAPYWMEQQREGERRQPPERGAPHTLPQPWEQSGRQPMENPQGGAATEPSRLALYGPQEQEKMLRLLREKGLQTPLLGDTLNQKDTDGQALLRLSQQGEDENAKASEEQRDGTEYGRSLRKRNVGKELNVNPEELAWDGEKYVHVTWDDVPQNPANFHRINDGMTVQEIWQKDQAAKKEFIFAQVPEEDQQDQLIEKQMTCGAPPLVQEGGRWKAASWEEAREYMFPDPTDPVQKYQFLRIDLPEGESSGLTVEDLNDYLQDTPFEGFGATFLEAERVSGLDVAYLVASALLEGTDHTDDGEWLLSALASGQVVGNGTYYNVYGWGAVDGNAVESGAEAAKEEEWDSIEKAIIDGALAQRELFVDERKQKNCYQMRWNPRIPGTVQYATAANWAEERAKMIEDIYARYGEPDFMRFDYYMGANWKGDGVG